MVSEFECPRQEDKCSQCLAIAALALNETLKLQNSSLTEHERDLIVENTNLKVLVEVGPILNEFSCDARRSRAENIGKRAAQHRSA